MQSNEPSHISYRSIIITIQLLFYHQRQYHRATSDAFASISVPTWHVPWGLSSHHHEEARTEEARTQQGVYDQRSLAGAHTIMPDGYYLFNV
jgi:hypothetical protein